MLHFRTREGVTVRLILVRHGQSQGNIEARIQGHDDPLTELGRAQARAAGAALARRGDVTHLYASSLDRAFETATIIGEAIGLVPVRVPGLAEINAGTAAGLLWAEWAAQNPEAAARIMGQERLLTDRWTDGESGQEFADRVFAAYDEIVNRHLGTEDVVVAVSHGGPLAWISARVHGDPIDQWPSSRGIFLNCSISELSVGADGHGEIVAWNGTDHLDGLVTEQP
jgi:broad specificity phosphatase PhoE